MRNPRIFFAILCLAILASTVKAAPQDDKELLQVRKSVWVAWFSNDQNALKRLLPDDTILISAGETQWKHRADVLQSAADFQAAGGKLLGVEFPRTEVQHFGDVAVVWSEHVLSWEVGSQQSKFSGRVTEIFVKHNGHWTNPGWHTDAQGSPPSPQE